MRGKSPNSAHPTPWQRNDGFGGVPEWLKGTGCKPVGVCLRWFESNPLHQPAGGSVVGVEAAGVEVIGAAYH